MLQLASWHPESISAPMLHPFSPPLVCLVLIVSSPGQGLMGANAKEGECLLREGMEWKIQKKISEAIRKHCQPVRLIRLWNHPPKEGMGDADPETFTTGPAMPWKIHCRQQSCTRWDLSVDTNGFNSL